MPTKKHKKILVIGDVHTPFQDDSLIKEIHDFNKKFKADLVLCTGDMIDQKYWSRYPKDPEDDGGELEWQKAIAACKALAKLFPKMVILNSNHDIRYIKKAREAGLVRSMVRTISEIVGVPGWTWHMGPGPFVINNEIACFHGDELQGAPICKAKAVGMSTISGHTHKSSITYYNTFNKQIWAMDAGCVVDPKAAAFNYAASAIGKVWTGWGYIENGVPHLIPKKKGKR